MQLHALESVRRGRGGVLQPQRKESKYAVPSTARCNEQTDAEYQRSPTEDSE